ncbi:hypothetical protein CBM2615_B200004 [Cupriavidus taiwanensis]|uniref:Uncharacterized protein n=1 Tax=Cupriavidus taiwanensis TaxID=164546 RepID=A0A375EAZ7_9BURK|nr:hypothetical protein CBM2614_B210004 [Cupriavidus taiwanensis]SOZ68422.1 hypothetical protein CBM2615_B200004 [Cupriavidus taiwanensis]SOZ71529.1 hypothetical protein CBM2613_B180004 [Cupriavidus taiwanensis]SPA09319.1 hypothetical protein CBM2625_B180004 [Cupriavidus taiwanensis]
MFRFFLITKHMLHWLWMCPYTANT